MISFRVFDEFDNVLTMAIRFCSMEYSVFEAKYVVGKEKHYREKEYSVIEPVPLLEEYVALVKRLGYKAECNAVVQMLNYFKGECDFPRQTDFLEEVMLIDDFFKKQYSPNYIRQTLAKIRREKAST